MRKISTLEQFLRCEGSNSTRIDNGEKRGGDLNSPFYPHKRYQSPSSVNPRYRDDKDSLSSLNFFPHEKKIFYSYSLNIT